MTNNTKERSYLKKYTFRKTPVVGSWIGDATENPF